jgi:hypothetical protein
MPTPLDTRPPRGPHPPATSSETNLDDTDITSTTDHPDNATVDFERLAHDIARAGINALTDDHLDLIERSAHAVGVRPVLIDILLDSSQPEVARARAYGRITTKILNAAWAAPPRRP